MTSTEPAPATASLSGGGPTCASPGTGLPTARPTRQRRAITAVLDRVEDFRSAQQIHDLLHTDGATTGLSTVYRTLQSLADSGEVDVLRTDAGEALYRACSPSHHHHLVCRSCGRTVEVEGPALETWTRAIASEHGFREVSHTFELSGTCPTCR